MLKNNRSVIFFLAGLILIAYLYLQLREATFQALILPPFLTIAISVVLVSAIFLLGFEAGRVISTLWSRNYILPLPLWFINLSSIGFGLGLQALVIVGIGLTLGFYRQIFIALFFSALIISLFVFLRFIKAHISKNIPPQKNFSPSYLILISLLLLLLTGYFLTALIPPVSYDVLEYHLSAPKEFIRTHSFAIFPYLFYVHMPLNLEMLYTLGISLEGREDALSPKLINFGFLLLIVLATYYWAKELGLPAPWALLAGIFLLANPVILRASADALNDLAVCLWLSFALISWYFWSTQRGYNHWLLFFCGIFVGLGIGTKYPVIFLYFLPALLILIPAGLKLKSNEKKDLFCIAYLLTASLLFISGVVIALLPWVVKNWLINKNPFCPFLSALFPGSPWTVAQEKFYILCNNPVAPWEMAYWKGFLQRIQTPGILYFLPALLIFLLPSADLSVIKRLRLLIIFSLVAYLFWNLWAASPDRFLIAIIPLLVMATIYVISWLEQQSVAGKIIAIIFYIGVALQTLPILFNFSAMNIARYGPLINSRDEFRKEYLGPFADALNYANSKLPPEAKLLLIYEARPYYFRHPVVVNSVFDQSPLIIWLKEISTKKPATEITLQDLVKKLSAEGVTHCLVNEYELLRLIDFFTPASEKNKFPPPHSPEFIYPLYPPWLNDTQFPAYRPLIGEFLKTLKTNAEFITPRNNLHIYITPLNPKH